LEGARKDKIIGHSLDAKVVVHPTTANEALVREEAHALEEVLIISGLTVPSPTTGAGGILKPKEGVFSYESEEIKGLVVEVTRAPGEKCERCWHYSTTVGADKAAICARCVEALK